MPVFNTVHGEAVGRLAGIARREKKRAPMETLDTAEISPLSGVAKDARGKPGKRQVTLLCVADWQAVCEELGEEISWLTRRSNLLIDASDFPARPGQIVTIGDVRLKTTVEIDPCSRMDEQVPGLTEALRTARRGGIGCEVLQGGLVKIGAVVTVTDAET
jgi:MOSC domain-containing protein YiiM